MVAEVQKWNVGWPIFVRKRVESLYLCSSCAIDQITQHFVYDERIVDSLLLDVGLSHQHHGSSFFRAEQTFHRGSSDRLVSCQILSVKVTSRKDLQQRADESRGHSEAQKDASIFGKAVIQQIEGSHCSHDKSPGDDSAAHGVRILQKRPGIQQQSGEAVDLVRTISKTLIRYGMLHPCIGDDDEVARQPRAHKHHESCPPMSNTAQSLLSEQEQPEEGGLEKE